MEQIEVYNEIDIIDRIIQGDKKLYELIVRKYNPILYKIGRTYNYNLEDTQDLMQDTFIDAYKNLSQFEGKSNFKTWIIRIMMNNCYRKREKLSYKNEIMQEINEQSNPLFSSKSNSPEQLVQNMEIGNIIETALAKLPDEYRIVFSLREINHLSVAETSSLLNISESNVKIRLNRAKKMLRDEIENSYPVNELFEFNLIYCDAMVNRVMNAIDKL